MYIQSLTAQECKDEETMMNLLEIGEQSRITAATNLNEQSSRSHSVFRFNIEVKEQKKNGEITIRTSQFNLVDLAGSEGVSRTKSEGMRLREGSNINKSLLALSKVIQRLSSSQNKGKMFINYRDSKLTRILQPSLGGNSQTIVICTLSQLFINYQESVKTLLFGQMAKNVKTIVNVNEIVKNKEAMELKVAKQENDDLKDKIHQLEVKLKEILSSSEQKVKSTPFSTPQVDSKKLYNEGKLDLSHEMEVDKQEASHISSGSSFNSSVTHLKEQISYLHGKIFEKSEEIDRKNEIIRKIQTEKSEIEQKFEAVDIKENEARKEIEILKEELSKHNENLTVEDIRKEFEKGQNKEILDADGIK